MADPIGDIIGGIFGSNAASQQAEQAQKAEDLQQQVYANSSGMLAPYAQGGQQSLAQLLRGLQSGAFDNNVNPNTLASDPGYQFRMQQAQLALQRSSSARGMLGSGAFMKGLDQYSQGLASQEYQNAWQRKQAENQAKFGHLYETAGLGARAADQYAGLGQGYANSMSSLYGAMGNANAAGTMAWGGALSGVGTDLYSQINPMVQTPGTGGSGGGQNMMSMSSLFGGGGSALSGSAGAGDALGGAAGGGSMFGDAATLAALA